MADKWEEQRKKDNAQKDALCADIHSIAVSMKRLATIAAAKEKADWKAQSQAEEFVGALSEAFSSIVPPEPLPTRPVA